MATDEDSSSKISVNNNIEWNVTNEVKLLLALMGHKPVGVAKYFHMACILSKFSESIKRDDISSQVIWDRLDTMYDLQALEETEAIPFPNDTQDFSLPQSQYGPLLDEKKRVKMPPPPAPSPPPDIKNEDAKEAKKEMVKDAITKKDVKGEERKVNTRDSKKDLKEDIKKDKRLSKEPAEIKKETAKVKEVANKEPRLPKRASIIKDDEDSSVSSTGSTKKSRDNSDTDDAASTPKRGTNTGANSQSANGKGKRQTRLSHAKVSDDSGSNKSISPLTVPSPATKRRRQM
ncbi:hypothetical protein ONE63_008352 [Megalurothrips usitatus]|uniref:Chromatin modification-related protein EAF7 n=1 Tax=Megalurothrips usitatus TaxID=439358 RepID=A0AAV7XQN0_9NEOP|nr:hypothetical protein ONE63_008352 [Megalurothrips usitatus]